MRIIIDAMGGDNAPHEIVAGAINAAKEFGVDITLVGKGDQILSAMKEKGIDTLPEGVEIAHADEVVSMEDDPTTIIKTKRNSSMVLGLKMLADGQGDAFISAGSTGALLSAATLLVKRIKGIRRAAFSPILPNSANGCVLIDAGANNECTPEFLMQFAFMGSYYAKKALNIESPRVGILNNGTEETKGLQLQKDTYALLKAASEEGKINFVGNVEARGVPLGDADVIVCDGFTGNILLKTFEGTALLLSAQIKKIFMKNLLTKIGALFCKGGISDMKAKFDYRETGGTVLMGITKPVIKAHGSSDNRGIRGAIKQAKECVELDFCGDIAANISQMVLPRDE